MSQALGETDDGSYDCVLVSDRCGEAEVAAAERSFKGSNGGGGALVVGMATVYGTAETNGVGDGSELLLYLLVPMIYLALPK